MRDVLVRFSAALLLATFLLAAGAARAGDSVLIADWKVVGPFEAGSREGFVHHLAGRDGAIPRAFSYEETYPSVLADGGRVAWRDVAADRDAAGALTGRVSLKLEGVGWEARESEWGGAAMLNGAYASATFQLPAAGLYLLEASRCVVTLNGVAIAGDPYGARLAQSIVRARAGANDVLVATSGFGAERAFELKLTPVESHERVRIVTNDVLLPDLVENVAGHGVVGVPLISAHEGWQDGLRILIDGALSGSADLPSSLPPLGSLKVAVSVRWGPTAAPEGDPRSVPLRIRVVFASRGAEVGPALATASVSADVRGAAEPRNETFVSKLDGSAQKHGLLAASSSPDGGRDAKALILSLHGAGVDSRGQVASYSPKSWAHVVAPTNRRPYGFDWHDWGALDAEEVLRLATERLAVDPKRIHLSGHSMGGHGTWAIGTSHAGVFATIAPSAGWNSYDTYLPPTLRRSVAFAPPELAELWQRGISPGRASTHLECLVNTPVFVLHGGADDNVPPTHGRLLAGELERLGGRVTYREVPAQGHWWDQDQERPGADCVDSAELEAFWREHELERWPRRVVLTSADPDLARSASWVSLDAQERVREISRIEAEVSLPHADANAAPRVIVTTRNVLRFGLHLGKELIPGGKAVVVIDGREKRVSLQSGREVVTCRREAGHGSSWIVVSGASPSAEPTRALSPGGYQKALYEPFTLVVGTLGDDARDERMLDLARALALAWWVRANGTCPVVRDVDVTNTLRATRNLVILGGPEANAEAKRLERGLLLAARVSGATLAGRALAGVDLACAHWQVSPDHPARRVLVFQATTPTADALLGALNPIASGHGLPDFVVATPAIRLRSWAGFAAAGHWSPDFRFDRSAAWLASR